MDYPSYEDYCPGRHFKAYNSIHREVLEHPSDTESVSVKIQVDAGFLMFTVTGFVRSPMRILGQKERVDLYILQEDFRPRLSAVADVLAKFDLKWIPKTPWQYGAPRARSDRQGVPELVKLAEVSGVFISIPFTDERVIVRNATMIADSEVPGQEQTKWRREGGSRQLHFGVFGGDWERQPKLTSEDPKFGMVQIAVPSARARYPLVDSILTNWVEP